MFAESPPDYAEEVRQLSKFVSTTYQEQLNSYLASLRQAIENRPVYVMFEDKLGCDPMTDHQIPKQIFPLFEESFALETAKNGKLRTDEIASCVSQFCKRVIEQETRRRKSLEYANQQQGGEIIMLNGLLQVHERNLAKLETQVGRLSKSLESMTFAVKEQTHYKVVIGKMYYADGEQGYRDKYVDAEAASCGPGTRNITELYQRYVSGYQALEAAKSNANKLLEQVKMLQAYLAEDQELHERVRVLESQKSLLSDRVESCLYTIDELKGLLLQKEDEIQQFRLTYEQLSNMVKEASTLNPEKIRYQIEEGVREQFAEEVKAIRETTARLAKENYQLLLEKKQILKELERANEQIRDYASEINEMDRDLTEKSQQIDNFEEYVVDLTEQNENLKRQIKQFNEQVVDLNYYVASAVSSGDKKAYQTIVYLYKQMYVMGAQNEELYAKLKAKERDLRQLYSKSSQSVRSLVQQASLKEKTSPARQYDEDYKPDDRTSMYLGAYYVLFDDLAVQTSAYLCTDKAVQVNATPIQQLQTADKRYSEFDIHCYDINRSARDSSVQNIENTVQEARTQTVFSLPDFERTTQAVDQQLEQRQNNRNVSKDLLASASLTETLTEYQDLETSVHQEGSNCQYFSYQNADFLEENAKLRQIISSQSAVIEQMRLQISGMQQNIQRYYDNFVPTSEIPKDTRVYQYLEFEATLKADLKVDQKYLETQLDALKEAQNAVFSLQQNLNAPPQYKQELQDKVAKIQQNLPMIEGLLIDCQDNAHAAYMLYSVTQLSTIQSKMQSKQEKNDATEEKRQISRQLRSRSSLKVQPSRSNMAELSYISATHERLYRMAAIIQERLQEARERYSRDREVGYRRYLESMRCLSQEEMSSVFQERASLQEEKRSTVRSKAISETADTSSGRKSNEDTRRSYGYHAAGEIQLSVVDLQPYDLYAEQQFVYHPEKVSGQLVYARSEPQDAGLPALRITQTAGGERRVLAKVSLFGSNVERLEYLAPPRQLDYLEREK